MTKYLDFLQFLRMGEFQLADVIELIQSSDAELSKLLLARTDSILEVGSQYADSLLRELQGSLSGTEEVLRLKLLDHLRVACGHILLERCNADELRWLVTKIAIEDAHVKEVAAKLCETKNLLAMQNMGPTTKQIN